MPSYTYWLIYYDFHTGAYFYWLIYYDSHTGAHTYWLVCYDHIQVPTLIGNYVLHACALLISLSWFTYRCPYWHGSHWVSRRRYSQCTQSRRNHNSGRKFNKHVLWILHIVILKWRKKCGRKYLLFHAKTFQRMEFFLDLFCDVNEVWLQRLENVS